jgi:energy-coupling factor transport system substrate-specific component
VTWQLGAFGLLGLALLAGFAWYERRRPDARIVALVGTLAAFAALGRIAFAAVPNVKPTTDIVLISGYALGAGPGFAVGALAGLTSNFFFGQGPWTPWQMAAWGACGVIGAGLAWATSPRMRRRWSPRMRRRWSPRRAGWDAAGWGTAGSDAAGWDAAGWDTASGGQPRIGRWPLALVCLVVGFGFTAVQDVGDWVTYSDHSWAQLGIYVGKGIGFDAIHAAGCLVFALALGPVLIRSIQRFARRLQVTWIAPGAVAPLLAVALVGGLLSGLPRPASASAAGGLGPTVSYLRGAQNGDGGFGPALGQPSDQLFSGWAGLGLASAGYNPLAVTRGSHGLIGYVKRSPGSDVGSLERTILLVRAAGLTATSFAGQNLVAMLRRHVSANGSVSGQVNLTSFAVLALRAADVPPGRRTLAWLVRQQDSDGGFSFARAGAQSDIDDTGATLEALARDPTARAVRARAIAYLRRHQDRDGGFPSEPGQGSNAQSTAWAVQGLDAAGADPASLHRGGSPSPLAYLRSLIAPNGSLRYARGTVQTPVWVTGEGLMALEDRPLPLAPLPAPASVHHLPAIHPASPPAPAAPFSHAPSSAHPRVKSHGMHRKTGNPETSGISAVETELAALASRAGVAAAIVLAPIDVG